MTIPLEEVARNLAANLLQLRKQRQLTQATLARLAEVPRSTIALLESGSANPSIASLLKIAGVLQVSLEELTTKPRARCQLIPASEIPIHRRSKEGVVIRKLLPDPIPAMDMDELVLEPGRSLTGAPHLQGTKEYLTCVEGEIHVTVSGDNFRIGEGDVLAFPGDQAHSYHNRGARRCVGISVVALTPRI